jgi:hypothetical protein
MAVAGRTRSNEDLDEELERCRWSGNYAGESDGNLSTKCFELTQSIWICSKNDTDVGL